MASGDGSAEPTAAPHDELLGILETRFGKHRERHPGVRWDEVRSRLQDAPEKLRALGELERTGGEPDVVGRDPGTSRIVFFDCALESPAGRRSLCYDEGARESRKKHRPHGSAVALASAMGATLLSEVEYHALQELGEFDTRTSSWLLTPSHLRSRGGALFGDRRYGRVFIYHNGAESYYAARGFRCVLRV